MALNFQLISWTLKQLVVEGKLDLNFQLPGVLKARLKTIQEKYFRRFSAVFLNGLLALRCSLSRFNRSNGLSICSIAISNLGVRRIELRRVVTIEYKLVLTPNLSI